MKHILQYRIPIVITLMLFTILLGLNIPRLTRDAGVSTLVATDHPDYLYWTETEDIFGATDQIVIGMTANESIYTPDAFLFIHELTGFLEERDDLDEDDVLSLTNVDDMEGLDGELLIDPLVETEEIAELDGEALTQIREKVRSNPLFYDKLVSTDERSTVIIAGVLTNISTKEEKMAVLKADVIAKLDELQEKYPGFEVDVSGPAMLKAFISEYMKNDLQLLFPLAILVVAVMLLVLLRSVYGMIIPILVTLFSIVWTLGLKGALASPLTIVETTIPIMLIAIGCADGVHIISEFFGFHRRGYTVKEALLETMRVLSLPVVLTSVTTALGFISLISAPGVSIKNMGIYLAFGVMVAMVFSLVFIPALTSFYRSRKQQVTHHSAPHERAGRSHSRFHDVTGKIGHHVIKHKFVVTGLAIIFLALSILGVLNIQVESDEIRYFKPKNAFRLSTERLQERLGGVTSLDIILEGPGPDSMKDPEILHAIWELQKFCEQDELVSYSLAVTDFIKRINYVLNENDPAYDRLPNKVEIVRFEDYQEVDGQEVLVEQTEEVRGFDQVAQFLLLYEMGGGESIDEYVNDTYQQARISVRLNDMSSRRLVKLLDTLKPYINEHFPETITVRYSNHYIRVVMMGLIIDSQIISLLTVLVTITLLMSVMFRSIVIGLITSLPVFIAVLFNFAVMWLSGVTLNIGTSIIASVGMGVGIDYAIHYFSRFRRLLQASKSYDDSLIQAIAETSKAILSNALAVGLGFLVLLFSEYRVVASIGWITALSMFTTALGSLIVLPALLSIIQPKIRTVENHGTAVEQTISEY